MAHGILTTKIARALSPELESKGFDVLYGHGQLGTDSSDRLGKLKSWFGPKYVARAVLADLDIAIVMRHTDQLIVLVEVEETTSKPKVLLGDVLATLLGSHITFQGKRHFQVGEWTSLIVLARSTNPAYHSRIAFLEEQANQLKTILDTPNAKIGKVVIRGFQNEPELEQMLRQLIQTTIAGSDETQHQSS